MTPLLADETRPQYLQGRKRPRKRKSKPVSSEKQRVDAATVASSLQLQEQRRECIYSLIALSMKLGLLLIGTTSLVKLGMASRHRLDRYQELSSILRQETVKLIRYQERFDRFFTIGGEKRLMEENDQMIRPNRVRVIWR